MKPLYLVILTAWFGAAFSLDAQVNCTASVSTPLLALSAGDTEAVGDLILTCTGGIPTPAGLQMPQVNFTIALNTNLTSRVTSDSKYSEALLLFDEPNSAEDAPQHPVLNCGQNGAPDNGPLGPGICAALSDGNPADSYDGSPNTYGTGKCLAGAVPGLNAYGCGRPNAFQGQLNTVNSVVFLGVPMDPPGPGGRRVIRFTNLRANATAFGVTPAPIEAFVSVTGASAIFISGPEQTVGFSETGLLASIPAKGVVRVTEGFAPAFKDKNISFTTGNGIPGNATFTGVVWDYNGNRNYPPDLAQNIPGTIYNTEDMFQWRNNGINGPPIPNPPPGFGGAPVLNLGMPLDSLGFGGINTGIIDDGVSNTGTRIALAFSHLPDGSTMDCPSVVHLLRTGTTTPSTGVMVLTKTDVDGAGAFTPTTLYSIATGNLAVYEVLYADPAVVEYADIACKLDLHGHSGSTSGIDVTVSLAPFYSAPSAATPTPTIADPAPTTIPRFHPSRTGLVLY
jgi:hypothetical protein